ncbi:MAG: GAF domain-containing protein [Pseudazoarcus pumilus]|nr:GAF domain-containing protein [Pseudazoarcus pumilus]
MPAAPLPSNESERLAALRALLILDTPPDQRLDRIVGFAAEEFDVPIALLSLVDADRQWFKARVGLDVCETTREHAFCAYALHASTPLAVPDALLDARFADNPLVTGAPGIRFYAGAPLCLEGGLVLGTLCIIDTRPRELDTLDLHILEALRDLILEEILQEGGV